MIGDASDVLALLFEGGRSTVAGRNDNRAAIFLSGPNSAGFN